ncbi:hypothetical protein [Candidatus Enterovibrio altilux]|uniref:Mobile element protein n=1 Tax=Candidatus Enterovibrio altilux TaxID=1927128 RepID=A0A291B6S4_9GAMM|nr:hypothetical protein [Candidatus Enterovibrio luxaltus]ATF08693.1 hypothetical protein BTN50_0150 [Candidatus Enterovibrio luxaltus]
MFQVKKLLKWTLSLRDDDTQMVKTPAMIKALNKLTRIGMPKMKMNV